jgi:AcrR family transcriptional regulator
MAARGEAVEQTRARILDAVGAIAFEELDLDPTLETVAGRAGVSVQTVLRHYGTRAALFEAAVRGVTAEVVTERTPPSDDPDAALDALVRHYERRGPLVLVMLARERTDPLIAALTESGKRLHRAWVSEVFAARLPAEPAAREALLDQLVVATDVYAWKLLRGDRHLPATVVRERMRAMTDALLRPSEPSKKDLPCPPP